MKPISTFGRKKQRLRITFLCPKTQYRFFLPRERIQRQIRFSIYRRNRQFAKYWKSGYRIPVSTNTSHFITQDTPAQLCCWIPGLTSIPSRRYWDIPISEPPCNMQRSLTKRNEKQSIASLSYIDLCWTQCIISKRPGLSLQLTRIESEQGVTSSVLSKLLQHDKNRRE